jgi:hypothetical protein
VSLHRGPEATLVLGLRQCAARAGRSRRALVRARERIVCALVAQLSGTFQREQADGTNVRVTMRLTESGKDPPAGHYFAYATAAAGLASAAAAGSSL